MKRSIRNEILILVGNAVLVGLVATGAQGLGNPLAVLRFMLGLVYILFIPGYVLQKLVFPGTLELDNLEHIALSFVLSAAVVPPITLILDWLPWGIRLWPMVIALSAFILLCVAGIVIRDALRPANEIFEPTDKLNLRTWWAKLERENRIMYIILAAIMVTASLTAVSILATPKPAERFTEFYVLGKDGLAEDYPRTAMINEPITVTVGITNREGTSSTYSIQVLLNDQVIGRASTISLDKNINWEGPIVFKLAQAGDDQGVEIILDREGQPSPYRSLRLWINVKAAEAP